MPKFSNTGDVVKTRPINDIIYTNPIFAQRIISHFAPQFKPTDTYLDPCRGPGAIYNALPEPKDFCEIDEGKDFLQYPEHANWCFANFPWSGKLLRTMSEHAYQQCDNVISLIRYANAVYGTTRVFNIPKNNHALKEIIFIKKWDNVFSNMPAVGSSLTLSIIHTQKNYTGDCKITYWQSIND